ncbi:MAG: hypothetical protein HZLCBSQH_000072 [Candidatus Fervidibacterota bacterium]
MMSREVTLRDLAVLGGFALMLVLGSYAYVRHATAPPAPQGQRSSAVARPLERTTETSADIVQAPIAHTSASPAALPRRDYRLIAERNIFQLPTQKQAASSPSRSPVPARPSRPTAPSPSPRGLGAPPPLPPAPPPLPVANSPATAPTTPASRPANLTATSIARLSDDTYVLLENPQTRDTAWVRIGESAFGYQVVNAGDNYVEVRQGDIAYRITLGEGKQERKIMATGTPSTTGAPPQASVGAPVSGSAPAVSPPQFQSQGRSGWRGNPTEWVMRVAERWNQLPEFVRNRILERVRENWNQLTPEQQQQVRQALQSAGANISLP